MNLLTMSVFLFLHLTPSLSHPADLLRLLPLSHPHNRRSPQQQLQITQPLPSDLLTPSCSHSLLSHSFAHTVGKPPINATYSSPPDCPAPSSWSHLVLQLDATCQGEQYDRIAAVWLAGAEILRTSTPEANSDGIFWNLRKDVTKYSSLFAKSNGSLTMMLENVVNDVFTGVFHVNLTLLVYSDSSAAKLGFKSDQNWFDWDRKPADLILPVADGGDLGFWFRIEKGSNVGSRSVAIPRNSRKVVLELYISAHGDDEFWYSNPPDVYIETNNLTTKRGNGSFREVFVRIDGNTVATEIPFPVIFTGGINPLFWEPVVSIGAFDLPSYDFDLTPFIWMLLDGENHTFEIGVGSAIDFWLIDANVHIWLDKGSEIVEAGMILDRPPKFGESWELEMEGLDGKFEVEAERTSRSSGWVACSCGNWTTEVARKMKVENTIEFQRNGAYKVVKQKVEMEREVIVRFPYGGDEVSRRTVKRKYPMTVISETKAGSEVDTYLMTTNVSHAMNEKCSAGNLKWTTRNLQKSGGWMVVKDHEVLSGSADTQQSFSYRNQSDCYSRQVRADDGEIVSDVSAPVCPSFMVDLVDKLLVLGW